MSKLIFFPQTDAGRALLRTALPFAKDPARRDGELPDGTSIYERDFDALARETERDYADFEEWRQGATQ